MDCSTPGFPVHQELLELKLMSIESVMPPNHLILCCPLLLSPSIIPSIRVLGSTWYETSNGISLKAGPVLKMPKRKLQSQDWGVELASVPWGILWPGQVTSLGPLSSLSWAVGSCLEAESQDFSVQRALWWAACETDDKVLFPPQTSPDTCDGCWVRGSQTS